MDTIVITKEDGSYEEMEVVLLFEKSNSSYHYIIYRNSDAYFVGKYLGEKVADLITDLDEEEMNFANGILSGIVGE